MRMLHGVKPPGIIRSTLSESMHFAMKLLRHN
nr:MAG TPA: hypothetical protein [Caudoviricetes sp.]